MPALSVCECANYQSFHWQPIRASPANIGLCSPRWAVCGENSQRRWLPQWALLLWSPSPCWSRKSRGSKEEVVFVIEPSVGFLTNDACCTPGSFALVRKTIQWKLLWLILVLDQLYTTSIISTAGWERISGGAFPPIQQLRPPTRGCPSSLRGSSAHAHFNITVLPNKKRCLDHPLEHAHYPSLSSWYKMFGSPHLIMRTMHIESWDLPYLGKMKRAKPDLWGMRTVGNPSFHWGWDDQL